MNNKVGLAIVTYTINFGTYLQAFATQVAVQKIGYETEIINIESVIKDVSKMRRQYFLGRIFDFSELKSYLPTIELILNKKLNRKFKKYYSLRENKFKEFHDKYFKIGKKYSSWKEMSNSCLDYSSVLVGSDQLWRPANIAGNFYTLNFVPDDINKISYATSFGLSKLRKEQKEVASKFLNRINYLSTREESGAVIIEQCTGRKGEVVCDPTMLLDKEEWNQYISNDPLIKEKYILVYLLNDSKDQRRIIKRFAKEKSLKIVGVLHGAGYVRGDETFVDEAPGDIGPLEFLNLIKYATYIFTDSFHGSVFSTIFEKQFYVFKRFSDKNKMSTNSRVTNLLNKLGLSGRLVDNYINNVDSIDYEIVNKKLIEFRMFSKDFLITSLEAGMKNDRG